MEGGDLILRSRGRLGLRPPELTRRGEGAAPSPPGRPLGRGARENTQLCVPRGQASPLSQRHEVQRTNGRAREAPGVSSSNWGSSDPRVIPLSVGCTGILTGTGMHEGLLGSESTTKAPGTQAASTHFGVPTRHASLVCCGPDRESVYGCDRENGEHDFGGRSASAHSVALSGEEQDPQWRSVGRDAPVPTPHPVPHREGHACAPPPPPPANCSQRGRL